MNDNVELRVGMQVAYIPPHVRGMCKNNLPRMLKHPDTEFGFVSSWRDGTVFCRFWSQYNPKQLRTLANSEGCDRFDLEAHDHYSPLMVETVLKMLRGDPERYGWHEQGEEA